MLLESPPLSQLSAESQYSRNKNHHPFLPRGLTAVKKERSVQVSPE